MCLASRDFSLFILGAETLSLFVHLKAEKGSIKTMRKRWAVSKHDKDKMMERRGGYIAQVSVFCFVLFFTIAVAFISHSTGQKQRA